MLIRHVDCSSRLPSAPKRPVCAWRVAVLTSRFSSGGDPQRTPRLAPLAPLAWSGGRASVIVLLTCRNTTEGLVADPEENCRPSHYVRQLPNGSAGRHKPTPTAATSAFRARVATFARA